MTTEVLLSISRTLIVIGCGFLLLIFFVGLSRVWKETRTLKALLGYSWEHADKLAAVGIMTGFMLVLFEQPFIPAGYKLSLVINYAMVIKIGFEIYGALRGYAKNYWTVRGTRRVPEKPKTRDTLLQTQF